MSEKSTNMKPCHQSPSLPLEPNKTHQSQYSHVETQSSSLETYEHESDNKNDTKYSSSYTNHSKDEEIALHGQPGDAMDVKKEPRVFEALQGDCGHNRLKRHRIEVAGRVWIPDIWGQEELLKDWTDCSAFDASLVPTGIMSARAALIEEGRRANSGRLRIANRC